VRARVFARTTVTAARGIGQSTWARQRMGGDVYFGGCSEGTDFFFFFFFFFFLVRAWRALSPTKNQERAYFSVRCFWLKGDEESRFRNGGVTLVL